MRQFQDQQIIPGTRYRVQGLIGSGGMGCVYDVEHEELGKRFVLKALHRGLDERNDLAARLRNEWRALGRLEHPNIVTVTDAGTSADNVAFYVMERLEGETLAASLRRHHELPVSQALCIGIGIVEGLGAAHDIGIIHRDVKPPNIFLTRDGSVKLLDFGIAKVMDHSGTPITGRGVAIGTPRYMSPEQARGAPVDGRADLYAVGLILFEMVSGRLPFDDALDPNDLLLCHLTKAPARLSAVALGIPTELDELVDSLLAKDARDRPSNARVVAEALREIGAAVGPAQHAEAGARPTMRWGAYSTEAPTVEGAPMSGAGTADGHSSSVDTEVSPDLEQRAADAQPGHLDPKTDWDPRTDVDPAGAQSGVDCVTSVANEASGTSAPSTLRLDESNHPDELPTRTAVNLEVLSPAQLTPPPVTSLAPAGARPSRRWLVPVLASVIGVAAIAAWTWMGSSSGSREPVPDALSEQSLPQSGLETTLDTTSRSKREFSPVSRAFEERDAALDDAGPRPEPSQAAPRSRRLPSSGL
jgi:serine/threonine-protein kinase